MDFLNSKHLTAFDAFIHPFRDAGTFTYAAQVAGCSGGKAGKITVRQADTKIGEGGQRDVVLRWDSTAGRFDFRVEDADIVITQNDFIVFQFDQAEPGQPSCYVIGHEGGRVVFDSRQLQQHDAFSHFFMTPGRYAYRVNGQSYQLDVADHRESIERRDAKPGEILVITLDDAKASVPRARIVNGQSVIWAIEAGKGVSIESGGPTASGATHA